MKVAFFDRDGTINLDYPDAQWSIISEPQLIEGSIDALKVVRDLGFEIIIITNQYIINEKYITLEQYNFFTNLLVKLLLNNGIILLDIFYCRHARWENCQCIKPKSGMIQEALTKYPTIDLSQSFIIGDSIVDMKLAHSLNMKGYGIKIKEKPKLPTVSYINSIKDLVTLLEKESSQNEE